MESFPLASVADTSLYFTTPYAMLSSSRLLRFLAVFLTGSIAPYAGAQTIFWDGSASSNWGAANWQDAATGGAAASFANGSDVVFTIDGGGANLSTTLGGNRTINSLTVNASLASALSISANRLTINGGGMDLSLAGADLTITSDITIGANQTWVLRPGGTLTVDNDIDGTARTLTIDGGGGATFDMGQATNNASDLGRLVLTNGTIFFMGADNQFNDYQTVIEVQAGTTYDRNNQPDAISGLAGAGDVINFSGGTINRDLDLRPNAGEVNVFSGTLESDFRDYQQTAGANQRNTAIGTQVFETLLQPDQHFEIYNGALTLRGPNGRLDDGLDIGNVIIGRADSSSSSLLLPIVTLDSSTDNHTTQDRFPDSELLNMRAGSEFRVIGHPTVLTTETIGVFELERSNTIDGRHIITLDDSGAGVALTSAELLRANTGTTVLFRGEGLGSAAAGAGVTNLIFTSAPAVTTAGSGTGTGVNILPFGVGDLDPAGTGTDFVTYGTDGVRVLGPTDYAASITSGANVELATSPAALGGDADLLALKMAGAGIALDLGGNTLDVHNGGILAAGTGTHSITNGMITFGAETEGFLHALQDVTLGATIQGANSFTKSGAGELTINGQQTYTGNTSVTEGTLTIIGNDLLRTNRMSLEGTLNLDNAATLSTSIGMLAGSARAEVNLGDNALELNGGGGNTSFFGTLNGSSSATLTKSGGNTFSWRSNNNLALTPFAGTVNITGGTFEIRDGQGRFDTASAFNISGGATLEIDNNLGSNTNNQNNRVSNDAPITLDRGNLTARASQGNRSTENIGSLIFNSGWNQISLDADETPQSGTDASDGDMVLVADSIVRNNFATGLVRGDDLAQPIGDAVGQTSLRLDTAPTLSHVEETGTNKGVVPWLLGGTAVGSGANSLLTFDTAAGEFKLLENSATDYSFQEFAAAGTLESATIGGQNTYIDFTANNSDAALDGDVTIRGLIIDNTGGSGSDVNLGGNTLTVESGVILSTGNSDNHILAGGQITFGNNAATGYEGHIRGTRTIYIDSPIVDNGGNAVSVTLSGNVRLRADNTFTGPLTVNTGRNYLQAANGSTNRLPDTTVVTARGNGILALNATDETIGGLEGDGFIENYNNTAANDSILTINNAADHVFSGVVRDGRAAPLLLTKDGAGSQTLTGGSASTYTGATSLMEGTLVLGGGLTNRIPDTQVVTFGDAAENTSGVLVLGDSLGALDQTLAGIVTVGTGTANHIVGGSSAISTLTLNQSTNDSISGNLGGAAGNEGNLAFVKNGVGELTVTGTTTLAGALTVNGGILSLSGASEVDGPVTVAAGANILNVDGPGLLGSDAAPFSVGDGAALNFRHGSSTQTFAGTGNVLSLDGTSGTTVLGFGVDGTSNDQISLATGQTLSLLGTVNADIYVSGAPTAGMNYTLIDSADDGAFTGGGAFQIGAIFNGGSNIYDVIRESNGTDPDQLILTVTAVNIPSPDDAWWNGDINNFWGALNTGGDSNWNTSETGGVDAQVGPDETSIVHFSTTTPAAANYATILDSDTTIQALVFHANSGTNGVSISPNTTEILTIGNALADPASLDVLTGGNDAISITTPIALGKSQSWNIEDGTSVLTIGGGISGAADLALNDNGTATGALLFNGLASTMDGMLTVSGGRLIFEDTGSLGPDSDVTLAAGTSIEAGTTTMEATSVILGGLYSTGTDGAVISGDNANNSTLHFTPASGDTASYGGTIGLASETVNENNLNLVKDGAGTQILDGAVNIDGTTLVQEGVLQFGSNASFVPGGVISVIADDGTTATFDINGQSFTTVGNTSLGGLGTTATSQIIDTAGTGVITLGGGIVYDPTNDPLGATISAALNFGGESRTITVNDSASAAIDLTISGDINDAGANTDLNLVGTGQGLISGVISIPDGDDLNVSAIGGTWTFTNTVSLADDFNVNDGTVILNPGAQIHSASGDDLIVANDNDPNPAVLIINAANAFVGDDLFVRYDGVITLGVDGALVDAGGTAGMDDLLIGDAGQAVPGGATFDANGFSSGVDQITLGGRVNNVNADLIEGHLNNTGGSRANLLSTSGASTFRNGTVAANLGGSGVLRKEWYGDVTLSGANTRTGNTEVRGGNLILDFSTSGADTESRIDSGSQLVMGRNNWRDAPATLTVNGHSTFDMTQTVASTNFLRGGNTIDVNSAGGAMNLALGAITQGLGATADFHLPANGSITTSNADGFLGGWAVVEGGAFANVSGGVIGALTSTVRNDLSTWMTGEDIINDAAYTGTADSGVAIQSLAFDAAAASTVQVDGSLDITSGGILITSNVGANASTISGGPVSTSGGAFYVHQHNTDPAGLLEISAELAGGSTLSKSGDGELLLSGTRNDLGTVYLHEGTLRVTGGDALADNQRLYILDGATTVFEVTAGQSETIGSLDGAVLGQATVLINAGSSLTVNQTSSGVYGGAFAGDGTLIKEGGGNLNYNGVSSGFTGDIVVEDALFQISTIGRLGDVAGMTINKDGTLLFDNNGGTRTGDRIGNNTPITLNSADGAFSGATNVKGLTIRTNQNAATNENIGVLNIASGASYAALEVNNGGTGAESQIIADDFVRTAGATLNVRGRDLGNATNVRTSQLRISDATNQTAFIDAMVGGDGTTATNQDIVPWAIGQLIAGGGVANTEMGNTLMTYVSGRGFTAVDLGTGYATLSGSSDVTDNVRESLTADLTGLTSQTVNALVIHNDNTSASTINVTGAGAGNTLTNTSGTFLFTQSIGADAGSAHSTILGGFDGIETAGSEYNFFVVDPTAAADTATTTVQIDSPLTSGADIVKSGRGTLLLTNSSNTAGGGANRTYVNEGVLEIGDLDQIGGDTGGLTLAGGTLRIGGAFTDDLGGRQLDVAVGGGIIDTNGVNVVATDLDLTGAGDLVVTGLGTLQITGTPNSTRTGKLIVAQGVLELNDTATSSTFAAGDLEIRPFTAGGATVTVRNLADEQVDDDAAVRLFNVGGSGGDASGSRWELNGFSETVSGLELTSNSGSSTVVTVDAGGTLTVTGDIILNNNRGGTGTTAEMVEITGGGSLDLGGTVRTIAVNSTVTADGTDAGIETVIENGGIEKIGEHILYLENDGNTFSGGTIINEGTVSIDDAAQLGADTSGNGIEIRNGASLQSTGAFVTLGANRTVLIDGSGASIEVMGASTDALIVESVISGVTEGGLTKEGAGALVLTAANTFEGGTVITEGSVIALNSTGSATGSGSIEVQGSTILGGDGFIAPNANEMVTVNGQLLVGDPLATAGTDMSIITSGTGSLVLGAGSTTTLDLWSGAGAGDNTSMLTAADLLVIGGGNGVTLGGTLEVLNPNGMTAWDEGDSWRIFDWTTLTGGIEAPGTGTNIFDVVLLPTLPGGIAWDTSGLYTTGNITIAPEPGRVALFSLGLLSLLMRRRRSH